MHLSLFIVFGIFLHSNFPTESRKVTPDGLVCEPFKADAFRRITTHLITTAIVNKLGSCAFRCLKNLECVSFNLGNPLNGKHVCELLRTDKYNSRSSYVTSRDFHYFYPVNKCMDPSSPCQNNGLCYPDYDNNDYHCVCNGTKGRNCEIYYRDCSELRQAGYAANRIFTINPDGQGSFPVYCDMTTDGGGWTVFQKRFDGSVDFYRGWQDYKTGFGNLTGEFWLGLDKIHHLTKRQVTTLRVDLEDWVGNTRYAVYSSFFIADESDFYRLNVTGYSGTAGDSLASSSNPNFIHNGMKFTTRDKDNDLFETNNAVYLEGAWWYKAGFSSHLNGIYAVNDMDNSDYKAMCWYTFESDFRSLKATQMKLK